MDITENDFDNLVMHTLRIELQNGMVLIYRIEVDEKQRLIGRLRENSEGFEENRLIKFLWFETSLKRQVIINVDEITRVTFCFDFSQQVENNDAYYDNFKVLEKDTSLVEESTPEGKVRLHVVTQEFLPSAIVFHKGIAPEDGYDRNPLLYYDLEKGCLELFEIELEDDLPLRQFINLIDMDGEENFILLKQIIVMEFEDNLLQPTDMGDLNNEDDEPMNFELPNEDFKADKTDTETDEKDNDPLPL